MIAGLVAMARSRRPVSCAGFTLIEVLIATAIVTAAFGVLLQLFNQGLNNLARAGEVTRRVLVERQIMHEISMLNPAQVSAGEGELEGFRYRWRSGLASPLRPVRDPSESSRRQLGLYHVQAIIAHPDETQSELHLERLGWLDG